MVFRTFGTDLETLIWEFNKYCSGEHICFNGKNGTQQIRSDGSQGGVRDFRILGKNQLGLYYRNGRELGDSHLITGTLTRVRQTLLYDLAF